MSHIFPAENRIMKENQMILFSVDSVLNFLVIADLFIQLLIPVIVDVIMISSYQNLFPLHSCNQCNSILFLSI